MFFFPFGVFGGEVVDPQKLAEEWREAARVAGKQTRWQWKDDCFSDQENFKLLKSDESFAAATIGIGADTKSSYSSPAKLQDPSASTNMWLVPYNRGLQEVGDGDVSYEWESQCPELIFVSYSFNYMRNRLSFLFPTSYSSAYLPQDQVRFIARIRIDGNPLPGAGMYVVPVNSLYRGSGLGTISCAPSIVAVAMLPAGAHTVSLFAGIKPFNGAYNSWTEVTGWADDESPVDGVRIGARNMSLLRFGRGSMMGG